MSHELDSSRAQALRGLFGDGPPERLHLPGDPGYETARLPWNLAVDQRPAAVVDVHTPEDVSTVIRAATITGLRVAPQTTGHNAGPLAGHGLDDVVILRTRNLDELSFKVETGIVRVGGGALWEPAVETAAKYGRAVLHGSSPDVGIAGYSLGGGMGWYARELGLATNSLTAVEIAIGDGSIVRADAEHNKELFWAVRGGGGSFGVVTALEFTSYPIRTAYAGMLVWDLTRAESILREWAAWAPSAPREVTTSFRAMRLPPLAELPDLVRDRQLVIIDGAILGSDACAEQILAPLRALRPEIDTFGRVPAHTLTRLHMDPESGTPVVSDSANLTGLPAAGIDTFLAEVGPGAETCLLVAELRQLGGAVGQPAEGAGVLTHVEGQFLLFGCAIAPTPELATRGRADASRLIDAMAPWASSRRYLNFVERPIDTKTAYRPEAWLQLKGIRSAVDAYGVFAANHPVPRLYEHGYATP